MSVWFETFEHGEMKPLVCPVCGFPAEDEKHPDGSRTLRCPCGRLSVLILAEGAIELDLGIRP